MNKKFAAIGLVTIIASLTTCSSGVALGSENKISKSVYLERDIDNPIVKLKIENDARIEQEKKEQAIAEHKARMSTMLDNLRQYVDVTPYVPYAASPGGWDCSGLVRWAYGTIGIDIWHGATRQRDAGTIVSDPQPGDIVVFGWAGEYQTQHSGIYIGDGMMLHAGGKEGDVTNIMSIEKWANWNGNTAVTYTRIN